MSEQLCKCGHVNRHNVAVIGTGREYDYTGCTDCPCTSFKPADRPAPVNDQKMRQAAYEFAARNEYETFWRAVSYSGWKDPNDPTFHAPYMLARLMADFAAQVTAADKARIEELEAEVVRLRSLWSHSMVTDDRNSEATQ